MYKIIILSGGLYGCETLMEEHKLQCNGSAIVTYLWSGQQNI